MAVNEQIVTGRKFRKLVDEATKLWQRISFWTKASDVEFDDGSTAETKMGAINGITDSLASTSSNIAASAKALSQLNNKLIHGNLSFEYEDGNLYAIVKDGADTVSKKLGEKIEKSINISQAIAPGKYIDIPIPEKTIVAYVNAVENTAIQGCLLFFNNGATKLFGYRCSIQKISNTMIRIAPPNDTYSETYHYNCMYMYIG